MDDIKWFWLIWGHRLWKWGSFLPRTSSFSDICMLKFCKIHDFYPFFHLHVALNDSKQYQRCTKPFFLHTLYLSTNFDVLYEYVEIFVEILQIFSEKKYRKSTFWHLAAILKFWKLQKWLVSILFIITHQNMNSFA